MARYTGAKNRLARRFGIDLGLKGPLASAKLARRLNIPPGQHGLKGRRRTSEFKEQLAEKQKLKLSYGILERQLRKYYEEAAKRKGATGLGLLMLLERRLDNVVYRLGLTPTRAAARQLISHGHVQVDAKKVNAPSMILKPGQVVTLTKKGLEIPTVLESLKNEGVKISAWLSRKAAAGKVERIPIREEIDSPANEQLVVEYYSR